MAPQSAAQILFVYRILQLTVINLWQSLEMLSFAHSARSGHRIRNLAQGRVESLSDDLNLPGCAQPPFLIDPGALQPPDLGFRDLRFSDFECFSDRKWSWLSDLPGDDINQKKSGVLIPQQRFDSCAKVLFQETLAVSPKSANLRKKYFLRQKSIFKDFFGTTPK